MMDGRKEEGEGRKKEGEEVEEEEAGSTTTTARGEAKDRKTTNISGGKKGNCL